MVDVDYRCDMSTTDFDMIPVDEDYPIDGYYEALIDRNVRVGNRFFEDAELLKQLTIGQRMLIQLGVFDSQVRNGGITQFFWNCSESIFDVTDWFEQLQVSELQANYDRALEALVGKKDRWLALREEWVKGRENPNWETFRQTYDLLDLKWFDEAYFGEYGYKLLTRLAGYVRTHKAEFIVE